MGIRITDNVNGKHLAARMDADNRMTLRCGLADTATWSAYNGAYIFADKDGWYASTMTAITGTRMFYFGITESAITTGASQVKEFVIGGPTYLATTWAAAEVISYGFLLTTAGALSTGVGATYTGNIGQIGVVRTTSLVTGTTGTYGVELLPMPVRQTS